MTAPLTAMGLALGLALTASSPGLTQESIIRLGFAPDWESHWGETELDARSTHYTVVERNGRWALRTRADRSASAVWRRMEVEPSKGDRIRWRWRVEHALQGNRHERSERGDDYVARVFVIFDAAPFSREARALCYVWASMEPPGSMYRNPYVANVATIVLQAGDGRADTWVTEERDFLADFRDAFGADPNLLTGVAVMTDTDDTQSRAQAWFSDMVLIRGGAERVRR